MHHDICQVRKVLTTKRTIGMRIFFSGNYDTQMTADLAAGSAPKMTWNSNTPS